MVFECQTKSVGESSMAILKEGDTIPGNSEDMKIRLLNACPNCYRHVEVEITNNVLVSINPWDGQKISCPDQEKQDNLMDAIKRNFSSFE